jgi:hydroxymethylbilane synthase
MTQRTIRIGTRRSQLALWQAEWVARTLRELHDDLTVEILHIRTLGDRDRATALSQMGTQGVFTKEIEDALLQDRCDVAVHSFKDLPTRTPGGLALAAIMRRADPRDALVSRSGAKLADLPPGSIVGTSSLRRRSQLLHFRPDLRVAELRGNVPTRLRAVGVAMEGSREPKGDPVDATILALAGLERLGVDNHATEAISVDRMVPAPAQGAVAVEIREDDKAAAEVVQSLDHLPTRRATAAERSLLQAFGSWCHIPVGALGSADGDLVHLVGVVGDLSGERLVRGECSGADPEEVGHRLAEDLRKRGAGEILEEILGERGESTDGSGGKPQGAA